MNSFRARRTCAAAVLAFLMSVGPAPAEVKLRIYLQDGSLQAGTLVAENPGNFVILTQEGRQEIPKKSIMFINGKTLKQWEERPDKLFQTEIIPSEIPNPAFVNDKSMPQAPALPAAPVLAPAPVSVVEKPATKKKKEVAPRVEEDVAPKEDPEVAEARAARAAAERRAAAEKIEQEKKAAAEQASVAKAEKAKAREKAKAAAKSVAVSPVPVPAKVDPTVSVQMPPAGKGQFDRAAAGASHHEKARLFRKSGELGRAIQEYHYARLLQPYNPDVYLSLGQLHLEQGMQAEARKFFSHKSLRKSDEAKKSIEAIDADLARVKEEKFRYRVAVGASAFAWLPVLVAIRLLRRRRKKATKQKTIDADALRPDDAKSVSELASPVPMAVPVSAPEPEPVVEDAPVEPPPPVTTPASFPGLPEFLENLKNNPVAEIPPAPEPDVDPHMPEPEVLEPAAQEEPVNEPVNEPSYEPVYEPVAEAPAMSPDPEEILAMARSVEHSLIRGNQWAIDGHLEEARRAYRTALALNAACVSAHIGLAYIAFAEEKWEVALLHYRKAIDIDPMSADAHYGVARVLLEINRVDDALPELRATLQIDPTYDDARDTLTALSKPA